MPTTRLSDEKREAVEVDLKAKISQRDIAKKHGISQGTVSNVKKGIVQSSKDQADPTDARILKLEAQKIAFSRL